MKRILKHKRTRTMAVWSIIIVGIVFALAYYWRLSALYPSTDDAYVNANIVRVAPQVSGPVDQVFAHNFQNVKQGQLLFTIDPRPFKIAVASAQAQLSLAKQQMEADQAAVVTAKNQVGEQMAQLFLASNNAKRYLKLVKEGQMSKQEGDQVTSKLSETRDALAAAKSQLTEAKAKLGKTGSDNAQIRSAEAKLNQAKLNLSYTKVTASTSGEIVNFTIRPGNMLEAGNVLFEVVDNQHWWVDSNYKETDLKRIHSGQTAKIVLDIYPDHTFHGKVYKVSPGSGAAFSILPPENATGNWVKVTQRFPVKVYIKDPSPKYPLRVGASATVTINTASAHANA